MNQGLLVNDKMLTIGRTEPRLRSVVEMIHNDSYATLAIAVSRQPGFSGPKRSA